MKLPSTEEFNFKECVVAGDACWLITPKEIGCKWTDDIARFRSCIVRQSDNFVVSQGFGKFTNYGERPEFQTWDDNCKFEARHKLDGSLLIVSKYKGQWILRTRGTVDARSLPNGHEIDFFLRKYAPIFEGIHDENLTFLFEWVTPTNIIVLRESNEPKLILLGIVTNTTCQYYTQYDVDHYADLKFPALFDRPIKYEYNSIAECLADVTAWQGKEGVVIYSPDYQIMKKIKADAYCELHKIATGLVTVKNVVELFLTTPRFTKYSDFYHYVETTKDFEVAEKIKDHMLAITVAYCKVLDKIEKIKNVVDHVRNGFARKEQALEFQQNWTDWRLAVAFNLLDNKPISDKSIQTAIFVELEV